MNKLQLEILGKTILMGDIFEKLNLYYDISDGGSAGQGETCFNFYPKDYTRENIQLITNPNRCLFNFSDYELNVLKKIFDNKNVLKSK